MKELSQEQVELVSGGDGETIVVVGSPIIHAGGLTGGNDKKPHIGPYPLFPISYR